MAPQWGTYAIEGLAVESLDVDTEELTIDIGDAVYVELKGVLITFEDFKFTVDKQVWDTHRLLSSPLYVSLSSPACFLSPLLGGPWLVCSPFFHVAC